MRTRRFFMACSYGVRLATSVGGKSDDKLRTRLNERCQTRDDAHSREPLTVQAFLRTNRPSKGHLAVRIVPLLFNIPEGGKNRCSGLPAARCGAEKNIPSRPPRTVPSTSCASQALLLKTEARINAVVYEQRRVCIPPHGDISLLMVHMAPLVDRTICGCQYWSFSSQYG